MHLICALAVLLLFGPAPAAGQWRTRALAGLAASPAPVSQNQVKSLAPKIRHGQPAYGYMLAGGLVAGGLGALAGASILGENSVGGAILGGGAGSAAGIPVGVHLGNNLRGQGLLTFGAGFGAGVTAMGLGISGGADYRYFLAASCVVALASSTAVEALTTR